MIKSIIKKCLFLTIFWNFSIPVLGDNPLKGCWTLVSGVETNTENGSEDYWPLGNVRLNICFEDNNTGYITDATMKSIPFTWKLNFNLLLINATKPSLLGEEGIQRYVVFKEEKNKLKFTRINERQILVLWFESHIQQTL